MARTGAKEESPAKAKCIFTRPEGIRHRDKRPPKGAERIKVVAVFTGSNHQVAARVWLVKRHELATRVDTGSGVSLIREDLLPRGQNVKEAGKPSSAMFDINGRLLPIKGTVALHVCFG